MTKKNTCTKKKVTGRGRSLQNERSLTHQFLDSKYSDLINFMRENGVLKLRDGDLELFIDPAFKSKATHGKAKASKQSKNSLESKSRDEEPDLLFHST